MKHRWQAKPAHLMCWSIWQMVTAGVVLYNKLLLYAVHLANTNCLPSCRPWFFYCCCSFFLFFFSIEPSHQNPRSNIQITQFRNSTADTQSLLLCWPFRFTPITIRRLFQESVWIISYKSLVSQMVNGLFTSQYIFLMGLSQIVHILN